MVQRIRNHMKTKKVHSFIVASINGKAIELVAVEICIPANTILTAAVFAALGTIRKAELRARPCANVVSHA